MSSLAGSFLVASPFLKSDAFGQSVVLLLRHSPEGAFGLVVNRLAEVEKSSFPVFCGGPCEAQGFLMLHGHADWVAKGETDERTVGDGIFLGDHGCLKRVSKAGPHSSLRYRVFTGFASWGPGQLEGEMAARVWSVEPASGELLFDVPAEDLWELLALPRIPQPSRN